LAQDLYKLYNIDDILLTDEEDATERRRNPYY